MESHDADIGSLFPLLPEEKAFFTETKEVIAGCTA
jgi:hypothetical protein